MAVIGALAFAIDSSSSVFELWLGLYGVFSGYLIPLELFPRWLEVTREAPAVPLHAVLPGRDDHRPDPARGGAPRARPPVDVRGRARALAARITWRAGLRRFAAFGG